MTLLGSILNALAFGCIILLLAFAAATVLADRPAKVASSSGDDDPLTNADTTGDRA